MDVISGKPFSKIDDRRFAVYPGNEEETLAFCVEQFVSAGREALREKGSFTVALSGGSTPKKVYALLAKQPDLLDWSRVFLLWSDERAVSAEDPQSNFRMAMTSGIEKLPIPKEHIFRMEAESDLEAHALAYEAIVRAHPPDLILLGVGEDGHTASLFPHTKALQETTRWVVGNYVPQKETWRMTFTFPLLDVAPCVVYALGASKAKILKEVFGKYDPETYPSQRVGTTVHPALWIIDAAAALPN